MKFLKDFHTKFHRISKIFNFGVSAILKPQGVAEAPKMTGPEKAIVSPVRKPPAKAPGSQILASQNWQSLNPKP